MFTGLSGSGKSSLAFDTIYAEGQRRYVESLSAYARQFLSMMEKPDVDHIDGLSPAISIEQKSTSHNPRSTVGTVTEVYDYLRLLFARAGIPRCPDHDTTLEAQTVSQMVDQVLAMPEGTRLMLLAPVVDNRKGEHIQLMQDLMAQGFIRARINGEVYELDDPPKLDLRRKHTIEAIVDRFKVRDDMRLRLAESFETALRLADGVARIAWMEDTDEEEPVEELREIVDFLKNPNRYQILGGRIPKGVLLVGPPGTGKTLLARAVAGEADVAFFGMSGSDFVEMFVGVGASRVRDLFSQAETRAPCIIFIDELDALGKARGYGSVGGHDEREQTLNQLLVEMDGFESNRGLILVAATNRPETLDPALLRPGRFDRTVVVDRPDLSGREEILKVHTRDVKLADDVDLRQVASMTPGSVGADLENIVNEAALLAARKNGNAVSMPDFNEAVERTLLGLERKSRIMTKEEKLRTAYHEAGHALVACSIPNSDPVHKVTIIPRGMAGGYVLSLPEEERFSQTKSELETIIRYCLGGTIAEEIIFNEIANGATSDLQKANHIAQLMVKNYGMSPLGRIFYTDSKASFLPGISIPNGDNQYSEETAREIDLQVRSIIDEAIEDVRNLLTTRRDALSAVAERLIEKETIDGSELRKLLEDFDFDPKVLDKTVAVDEKPNARE